MPTGAHEKHAAAAGDCKTCHLCAGVVSFDPLGAAVAQGQTVMPTFDATEKTCSNVACHGVVSGTYTYVRWVDDETYDEYSYTYGGTTSTTPSWYTSGGTCIGCHGNPPSAPASLGWHGQHAFWSIPTGNDCAICHPHVETTYVNGTIAGIATRIYSGVGFKTTTVSKCGPLYNQPCVHGDGRVDVSPQRTSACRCH